MPRNTRSDVEARLSAVYAMILLCLFADLGVAVMLTAGLLEASRAGACWLATAAITVTAGAIAAYGEALRPSGGDAILARANCALRAMGGCAIGISATLILLT